MFALAAFSNMIFKVNYPSLVGVFKIISKKSQNLILLFLMIFETLHFFTVISSGGFGTTGVASSECIVELNWFPLILFRSTFGRISIKFGKSLSVLLSTGIRGRSLFVFVISIFHQKYLFREFSISSRFSWRCPFKSLKINVFQNRDFSRTTR